jgi:UDP-GlcNAc:undecaprenyl-phosphate GlcNAc-1-phosphate transferase
VWRHSDIFVIACLVAAGLVPFVRWLAFRFDVLDRPKAHGIHTHPVPRIGGLAIYIAFVIGTLYRMDLSEMLKGVLLASSVIFITGFIDDIFHLRASLKLLIQIAACGVMMFKYGVILTVFPHVFFNAFFTALGIIGLTNAVNFLDNMDGLASGLVLISSLTIFAVSRMTGQPWLGYLSLALGGAACGFLFFNLRKAYVFMGDAGSTFLGFTLSSLCVMSEWSRHWSVTLAVPMLILGVPILDMFLITVLRIKEDKVKTFRQWIDYTGKDHLSHRVMRLVGGGRLAVASLWAVQGLMSLAALFLLQGGFLAGIFGLALFFAIVASTIFFFRRRRSIALTVNGRNRAGKTSRPVPAAVPYN